MDRARRPAILRSMVLLFALSVGGASAQILFVGQFEKGDSPLPHLWQVVRFDHSIPATRYRTLDWDGVGAVEAIADASMALLTRPLKVDLLQTPVLCWRWRVDASLQAADMALKSGDDYAARVYVTFTLPPEKLKLWTKANLWMARAAYGENVPDAAINYVWDNRYPIGTRQANAYTDRSVMLVLRSGSRDAGKWVEQRRNIQADAISLFGTARAQTSQLAIGTDTDNTGEKVRAGFADLHFVQKDQQCVFRLPESEQRI